MISGKFSANCPSTMVGGGNMAGEMRPKTEIACQNSKNMKAVTIGRTKAGT